jgi:stage II sporulation protein D
MQSEGGAIVELPAEKYVAAVLAGETSTFRSEEGRKAMAVDARTYAAYTRGRHAAEGFDFCATTHCQRADLRGITPDALRAADATAGELLWFKGKPALSVYSRDCGGETANVTDLWPDIHAPYLLTQSDPYCIRHGATAWSWTASTDEIGSILRAAGLNVPDHLERIVITEHARSYRARTLELIARERSVALSAGSLRLAVGRSLGWNKLRSDRYEIESYGNRVCFRGTGQGHGIGLCQDGADEMGVERHSYREILAFYYPGAVLSRTAGESLHWSQLSGEHVKLLSTDSNHDRAVLPLARALLREMPAPFPVPRVTIRVYPDLDAFRNATGEPGWVAARTSGSNIDLQPLAILQARGVLRSTLRHELLHVAIESNATPGLPLWFREGLVEYLADDRTSAPAAAQVSDADLAQREDQARARAAYAQARQRVAILVGRYGQGAVLGWVKRGLPAEVMNSSASSANTNSR